MSLAPPYNGSETPGGVPRQVRVLRPPACFLVREPCAGNPHARFDERGVETGHGAAIEAPADERAGNG